MDVSVLDAGGSPVWQKLTVPLEKGIYTDQFKLTDEPALGEWTIQVESTIMLSEMTGQETETYQRNDKYQQFTVFA